MDSVFKSSNGKYLVYREKTLASNDVCIAEHIETDEIVVVKILKNAILAQRELILSRKKLSHPNIIHYIHTEKIFSTTFIFMPKYTFSLQRYVFEKKAWNVGFSEEVALDIFKELCKPIEYLHNNKIAHRDIKLENYLVNVGGHSEDYSSIVLADFGLCYDWTERVEMVETYNVGTPYYMAHELVNLSEYRVHRPDVWALGVCLYILRHGNYPFQGDTRMELQHSITLLKYKVPLVDELSSNIIKKIFVYHYKRPLISEIF